MNYILWCINGAWSCLVICPNLISEYMVSLEFDSVRMLPVLKLGVLVSARNEFSPGTSVKIWREPAKHLQSPGKHPQIPVILPPMSHHKRWETQLDQHVSNFTVPVNPHGSHYKCKILAILHFSKLLGELKCRSESADHCLISKKMILC